MFKLIWKIFCLGMLFVVLSNYASCTREEYLIPQKAVQDTADVINFIHKGVYKASSAFQKTGATLKQFLSNHGIDQEDM